MSILDRLTPEQKDKIISKLVVATKYVSAFGVRAPTELSTENLHLWQAAVQLCDLKSLLQNESGMEIEEW